MTKTRQRAVVLLERRDGFLRLRRPGSARPRRRRRARQLRAAYRRRGNGGLFSPSATAWASVTGSLVRNDALSAIGGSALTDPAIAVPESARHRTRYSRNLCAVPQRPLPLRRRQLGRGAGRRQGLYRRSGAGQLGISRLPSCLLPGVQPGGEARNQRWRRSKSSRP